VTTAQVSTSAAGSDLPSFPTVNGNGATTSGAYPLTGVVGGDLPAAPALTVKGTGPTRAGETLPSVRSAQPVTGPRHQRCHRVHRSPVER
jgi:hypothetical protein